ncbi:Transmembrane protein [Melia azedarach]|uniref:Transmembrane protein n=1 Tax=Melia azedarach TaxID=155640 RepID=A0ACC1XBS9_MELAZ|nr:Transmembrane protein [Melia azedarach]
MEGLSKLVGAIPKDPSGSSTCSSSSHTPYNSTGGEEGLSAALSSDQSRVYISRSSRQVISLWTCSKLCTFFFVAGVFVGYTLKKRVRRWASKLLKRLKDD